MKNNKPTLQSIFKESYSSYRQQRGASLDQCKAAQAIMRCQTQDMGSHELICPQDDYIATQNHSCRHRACPRCHSAYTHQWLENIEKRLLPVSHYHVIFTLPHELNTLWQYNREWFQTHFFPLVAEVLTELLDDPGYLGSRPGMLLALHTWGRTLNFHPHIHALVTGGGIADGQWQPMQGNYLLPIRVLKAKYRGKWIAWLNDAWKQGQLKLPPDWSEGYLIRQFKGISKKPWNVRIEGHYDHGKGVAVYLSRYLKGGPIKDGRIIAASAKDIQFRYKDHHDNKNKQMQLKPKDFIHRILNHVPAHGRHMIRYYGLYSPQAKKQREIVREHLDLPTEQVWEAVKASPNVCPECGTLLRRFKISVYRGYSVQQDVQADAKQRPTPEKQYETKRFRIFDAPSGVRLT